MKTKLYQGLLCIHSTEEAEDLLYLSSLREPMAEALGWIRGKRVSVRYWITRQEASKDEAQEHFIRELMGNGDARFGARYSDLTGYLWTDEELKIGGHDLINELKGHAGNWLILEVDHK